MISPTFSEDAATALDPSAPRALYQQVKQYVLSRIQSGEWPPGARIPSENQLVKILKVSRMTANRALVELSREGHLVRVHGVGTFVNRQKPPLAFLEVKNIADEIAEWGGVPVNEVYLLAEETAGDRVADALGIEPGGPVYHCVMVHRDGDQPVQLSDRFVNPAVAPDYLKQDFTRISPTDYLIRVAPIQEAEHVVSAARPGPLAQQLLNIDPGEPCLQLDRRTWSFGQVATQSRLLYPGSRYRLGGRFRT
jgi:GntR family histidine utilization transcriptional repressor